MSSSNQVVFEFIGQDNVSSVVGNISTSIEGMSTSAYMALQDLGWKAKGVMDDLVTGASNAQQAWIAFDNMLAWNDDGTLAEGKAQVKSLAAELGRGTGEIRWFETSLMNMGSSLETAEAGARATSAAAAGTGKSFADAQTAIISAMKGRGSGLKELGFNIKDYQDAETGAIDTARLYADMEAKYGQAHAEYVESFAANKQRFQNAIGGLKTDFGQAAMGVENYFLPAMTNAVNALKKLPQPVKDVIGVGMDVVGTFVSMSASIADVTMAVRGMADIGKSAISFLSNLTKTTKTVEAATDAMTLSTLANEEMEIQAAAAHAGTAGLYTEEAVAKDVDTASTWGLNAATAVTVAEVLLLIGAIALIVAAFYEYGKSVGWWNDTGEATSVIMERLTEAAQWLGEKLKECEPTLQQIGGFLVQVFGLAYEVIMLVVNTITTFWFELNKNPEGEAGVTQAVNDTSSAVQQLTDFIHALSPVIAKVMPYIVDAFIFWAKYLGIIIGIIVDIGRGIYETYLIVEMVITFIIGKCQEVYDSIVSFITDPLGTIGGAAYSAFQQFASAAGTVITPLKNVYDWVTKIAGKVKKVGEDAWSWITHLGQGGSLAVQDSMQYNAMLESKGITAQVGNTSNKQNIQFNIDSVDVSANNLSPTEAKQVMISALESLNNVESVKLRRAV